MHARRYAWFGAVFGLGFPVIGTVIEASTRGHGLGPGGLLRAQAGSPLLWIVDTAPLFLAVLAGLAGRTHDRIVALDGGRRDAYLETASELFTAAQALLASVSSFSSTAAETAASVRQMTATMGYLGHAATKAALTAETVIGLARHGEQASAEGLSAVEAALAEMTRLTDASRSLAAQIDVLSARMRDVFEVSSVVASAAERSRDAGAKRAAVRMRGLLGEVDEAVRAAIAAAQVGVQRAEQGASVASGTGETIRLLATALRDASQAAKEIAAVAQQQDHGIEQVLNAMNEIYLATQETMSSTRAVATEARALNELASGLKRTVDA